MSELEYAKEIMLAQMEGERAAVSFNVYEEVKGQGTHSSMENYNERLKGFVPEDAYMGGNHEVTNTKSHILPIVDPPVDGCLSVKQPSIIQEPAQLLPVVEAGSRIQEPSEPPKMCAVEHHIQELPQSSLVNPPNNCTQAPARSVMAHAPEESTTVKQKVGENVARALRQVACMPKVEYIRFDGDTIKYVSFIHNFETCQEKENPDDARRLHLLIQHCFGKARDAIESCVNLPVGGGYYVAKNTLCENFGLPHTIAKAQMRKLENLRPLKQADGASLLEFSRHLEVNRTLSGMGPEYVSDLNHTKIR